MPATTLAKPWTPSIPLPLAFLGIFLLFRCVTHGQALYANLGPASFSQNWGSTTSIKSSYRRQLVMVQPSRRSAAYYDGDEQPYRPYTPSISSPAPSLPTNSLAQPTVPGNRAKLRRGIAYAPENAPLSVKRAIWATNTLVRKPYVWGGGHDSFFDRGYDCSGTVSFALHYAGHLNSPLDSRGLMSFGERGPGRWMTVYARNGHTWMVIAGLRLDTTGFYGDEGPRWRPDGRTPWGFEARHPVGL